MTKVYKLVFFPVLILGMLLLQQCTKIDSTTVGKDLIPPIDGVNTLVTDTFTITTENGIFNDTSRAVKADDYMLGQIANDPLFGRTRASIYTELKPAFQFQWRNLKDSLYYDSSFVNLSFFTGAADKGIYGDSTSVLSFNVYAITDNTNFKKDSSYLLATDPNIPHGTLVGSTTITPAQLNDQRIVVLKRDTVRYSNVLRVRLNATGDAMIRDLMTKDTNNVFKNDDNLRSYFKGFVFEPVGASGNAIMKFALADAATRLEIWYRFTKNAAIDTTVDYFGFNAGSTSQYRCASANYIERFTAGAPFTNYLTPGADSLVFLQSTPGTFATIRMPFIKSFPNKIIHRAELIIDEDPAYANNFLTPPPNLFLDAFDTTSSTPKFRFVPYDFYFPNPLTGPADFGYFGGNRKTFSDGLGQRSRYIFTVSKYLQSMISRNELAYNLRLYCPYSVSYYYQYAQGIPWPTVNSPVFGRVVVGGGNHTRFKMKLRVIYSNI